VTESGVSSRVEIIYTRLSQYRTPVTGCSCSCVVANARYEFYTSIICLSQLCGKSRVPPRHACHALRLGVSGGVNGLNFRDICFVFDNSIDVQVRFLNRDCCNFDVPELPMLLNRPKLYNARVQSFSHGYTSSDKRQSKLPTLPGSAYLLSFQSSFI
jgi:hypothetical protein